jgi:hypothetical protein
MKAQFAVIYLIFATIPSVLAQGTYQQNFSNSNPISVDSLRSPEAARSAAIMDGISDVLPDESGLRQNLENRRRQSDAQQRQKEITECQAGQRARESLAEAELLGTSRFRTSPIPQGPTCKITDRNPEEAAQRNDDEAVLAVGRSLAERKKIIEQKMKNRTSTVEDLTEQIAITKEEEKIVKKQTEAEMRKLKATRDGYDQTREALSKVMAESARRRSPFYNVTHSDSIQIEPSNTQPAMRATVPCEVPPSAPSGSHISH